MMDTADGGKAANKEIKARPYRHADKMDESRAFIHSIYNYYNNVNLYCH